MTEAQLAQVAALAQAIATAATTEAHADMVVDTDNKAIADLTTQYNTSMQGLQATLTADAATAQQASSNTQSAISALTVYVANPT